MQENFLKLTSTAYKIIEFFPESDPLKNRTKDKILAVMESFTIFLGANSAYSEKERIKMQISEDIDILLGYFWLAKCQGLVSDVNYLILSNEYKKIRRETEDRADFAKTVKVVIKNNERVNPRQGKIIDFLNNNEKAQVMDLQKVLGNVTKRTIRRDLDELLKTGRVVRMGEFNGVFYRINA